MLNKARLKAAMALVEINQCELAKKLGMSENTLTSRMNGSSCFDTEEIDCICECLNLHDNDEKAAIFLASSSH